MELQKIRYFIAVAKESSMQQAADSLHVSQSTLSTSIKNLEAELGVELFYKSGRKLELTDAGKVLLADGSQLIAQEENIVRRLRLMQPKREDSVAVGTEAPDFLTEAAIRLYRSELEIRFTKYEPRRNMIKPLLQSRRIDFAITLFDDSDSEIESRLILEEPFYVIVYNTHPLADRERIHFSQLEKETLVTISEYYGLRILSESFFGMAGIRPLACHVVSDIASIPVCVRSGYGIALIPQSAYQELYTSFNYIRRIEVDESFCKRRIYLTTLRGSAPSEAAKELADFLKDFGAYTQEHGKYPPAGAR